MTVIKLTVYGYVILYHKSNLVYTGFFPQFVIFQQNNNAQTSMLVFVMSRCTIIFLIHPLKQKWLGVMLIQKCNNMNHAVFIKTLALMVSQNFVFLNHHEAKKLFMSDRGTAFTSHTFKNFCHECGTKHVFKCSSYTEAGPMANVKELTEPYSMPFINYLHWKTVHLRN